MRYKTFLRMASCTLDFQPGNFTCILRMKSFEDISFKSLLLQGTDLKNTRRRFYKKLERLEQRNPCSRTDCIVSVVFIFKDNDRFLSISSTSQPLVNYIFDCGLTS